MKMLEQGIDGVREVRFAWQKSRSVAAEGGYLDLMGTNPGPLSLDWVIGNEKTLDLFLRIEDGRLPLDDHVWSRILWLLEQRPSLAIHLAARGVDIPE